MKVKQLFAFVGAGPDDGILAMGDSPESMVPMVFAEEATIERLRPIVGQIVRKTGKAALLIKFTVAEKIAEFNP